MADNIDLQSLLTRLSEVLIAIREEQAAREEARIAREEREKVAREEEKTAAREERAAREEQRAAREEQQAFNRRIMEFGRAFRIRDFSAKNRAAILESLGLYPAFEIFDLSPFTADTESMTWHCEKEDSPNNVAKCFDYLKNNLGIDEDIPDLQIGIRLADVHNMEISHAATGGTDFVIFRGPSTAHRAVCALVVIELKKEAADCVSNWNQAVAQTLAAATISQYP
ncbi:hypothetical protein HK405_005331, partial [Cladochytrium tenue]